MSNEYVVNRITDASAAKNLLLESICNDYPQYPARGVKKVFNEVWKYYSPAEDGEPAKDHKTYSAISTARACHNTGMTTKDTVDLFVSTYALKLFKTYVVVKNFMNDYYKR